MQRKSSFIEPALPVLKPRPPKGDGWLYEIKFDGYRVQLHVGGGTVTIYSKNGADFTSRFPRIAAAASELPRSRAALSMARSSRAGPTAPQTFAPYTAATMLRPTYAFGASTFWHSTAATSDTYR